jgi:hypothetical protein
MDEWFSSNSAVPAVFTGTLASMTEQSCRSFVAFGLTPDNGV